MPIYHLKPVASRLDDADWANSHVRSECWVNAADEDEARSMASARFQDASATTPGETVAPSAWRNARLVAATVDTTNEMKIPYGTVLDSGPHM